MFSKICRAFLRIPRWLRIIALCSIVLMSTGIVSNVLVITTNKGAMPVAIQKEDMLFVIGPAQFGVKYFFTDGVGEFDDEHQQLTKNTRFRILADRIPVSFKFIPRNSLPRWCYWVLNHMKITAGEDGIASIGDLLIWPGILLAYPTIFGLLVCLIWRIFIRLRRKT